LKEVRSEGDVNFRRGPLREKDYSFEKRAFQPGRGKREIGGRLPFLAPVIT